MNSRISTSAALVATALSIVSSAVRAEDPGLGAEEKTKVQENTPTVTDTPPSDFGPFTNSKRPAPYANLLGKDKLISFMDNGLGQSALSISGYLWQDAGFLGSKNEQPGLYDQKSMYMQGRFVLRAEYERYLVKDLFAQARVELMGMDNEFTQSTYQPHTLEMWAKVGQSWWDVQVGRFYPFLVYYRGLGVDLYTPEETGASGSVPSIYYVNYAWGLQDEPGQFALHFFPVGGLGIELSGIYGQNSTAGLNTFALRPAVDWKLGGLEVVAGAEWYIQRPQRDEYKVSETQWGGGGRVQYTFWLLTAGIEAAYAHSAETTANEQQDPVQTYHRYSTGGWVDFYLWNDIISVGLHHTAEFRLDGDKPTQEQGYIAYVHRLPINGLSVKFVYGIGLGHVDDETAGNQFTNREQSGRVRLQYLFQ